MLSPRFLRMQAEKCLRSALATADLDDAADLKKMARDLENWANAGGPAFKHVEDRHRLSDAL
jgi:hypothetical protein